MKDTKDIDLFV